MTIVPCNREPEFQEKVARVAELLKSRAHELVAAEGISEDDFYYNGYFRAAIEKLRGQYAGDLSDKKSFIRLVLNELQQERLVGDWVHAGNRDRNDYEVTLPSGGMAAIEQKGCLDGNNVNISERPRSATEFYLWSICTNQGSDISLGIRSGIQRIIVDMITTGKQIDALVVWDMICGSAGRPCPKIISNAARSTALGPHKLPPPCIYLFPSTVGHVRSNPKPRLRQLEELKFVSTLVRHFKVQTAEVNYVGYELAAAGSNIKRQVRIVRDGVEAWSSRWTPVKRNAN